MSQQLENSPHPSQTQALTSLDPQILPMSDAEMETYRLHRRYDRMGRLVGDEGMKRLFSSHVMIIGLGGVGSWAAESLARSGVGQRRGGRHRTIGPAGHLNAQDL